LKSMPQLEEFSKIMIKMTIMNESIEEVIFEHFNCSAFLWENWIAAHSYPHFLVKDFAKLEERLEARLDGLRSCEDDGWGLVQGRIADKPIAGEIFTAAVLAIESPDPRRLELVLQTVAKPAQARELASALAWFPFNKVQALCDRFLASPVTTLQLAGLSAYAHFRKAPGKRIDVALNSPDPFLRCRGLQAIGELSMASKLPVAKAHFHDEDPACGFRAAWSAALLGDQMGIQALLPFVNKKFSFADEAAAVAVRRAGLSAGPSIIDEFVKSPDLMRWAIIGVGALGDPSRIPWLFSHMGNPVFGRVSGEAFSMITGLAIAPSHMDTDAPEGVEETPNDNPDDEQVDLDADHFLPWPHVEKIKAWWEEHGGEFPAGNRYLAGKPIDVEGVMAVLSEGYQRQRYAAAIELMPLKPGEPLVQTRMQVSMQP
jgi:uncharacterized protein (TIGR02270 family)